MPPKRFKSVAVTPVLVGADESAGSTQGVPTTAGAEGAATAEGPQGASPSATAATAAPPAGAPEGAQSATAREATQGASTTEGEQIATTAVEEAAPPARFASRRTKFQARVTLASQKALAEKNEPSTLAHTKFGSVVFAATENVGKPVDAAAAAKCEIAAVTAAEGSEAAQSTATNEAAEPAHSSTAPVGEDAASTLRTTGQPEPSTAPAKTRGWQSSSRRTWARTTVTANALAPLAAAARSASPSAADTAAAPAAETGPAAAPVGPAPAASPTPDAAPTPAAAPAPAVGQAPAAAQAPAVPSAPAASAAPAVAAEPLLTSASTAAAAPAAAPAFVAAVAPEYAATLGSLAVASDASMSSISAPVAVACDSRKELALAAEATDAKLIAISGTSDTLDAKMSAEDCSRPFEKQKSPSASERDETKGERTGVKKFSRRQKKEQEDVPRDVRISFAPESISVEEGEKPRESKKGWQRGKATSAEAQEHDLAAAQIQSVQRDFTQEEIAWGTYTVEEGEDDLGMRFSQTPPGSLEIVAVNPDSWAERNHVVAGDTLVAINGLDLEVMSQERYTELLPTRPLRLLIEPRDERSGQQMLEEGAKDLDTAAGEGAYKSEGGAEDDSQGLGVTRTKSWGSSARKMGSEKTPARLTARQPSDATEDSTISFAAPATGDAPVVDLAFPAEARQTSAESSRPGTPGSTISGSSGASAVTSPHATPRSPQHSARSQQNSVSGQEDHQASPPADRSSAHLSWSSRKKAAAERLSVAQEPAVAEPASPDAKEIPLGSSPVVSPRSTPPSKKMKWIRKKFLKLQQDGKIDWERLFHESYDHNMTNHEGKMDFASFETAIRRTAQLSVSDVTDEELHEVFCTLETSGDGFISHKVEFLPWLNRDEDARRSGYKSAKELESSLAVTELKRKLKVAAYDKGKKDYRKLFLLADKNNDGGIDFDEFRALVRKHGKITTALMSDADVLSMFRAIDTNGDQTLSFEYDLMPWLLTAKERQDFLRRQEKEQAKSQPATADADGSPVSPMSASMTTSNLSSTIMEKQAKQRAARKEEIDAMVAKLKNRFKAAAFNNGKRDVGKLFMDLDMNNDGEIDFVEFRGIVRKKGKLTKSQLSDEELLELFRQVDVTGEGHISYQEFSEWMLAENENAANNEEASVEEGPCATVSNVTQRIKALLQNSAEHINWTNVFRDFDRTGCGFIAFDEFRSAFRKGARIPPSLASDGDLLSLFKFIDADGNNVIRYKSEFLAWLRSENGLCPLQVAQTRKSVAMQLPGTGEGLPLKYAEEKNLSLAVLEEEELDIKPDETELTPQKQVKDAELTPEALEESPIWSGFSSSPPPILAYGANDAGMGCDAKTLLDAVDAPEMRGWRGFLSPPTLVEFVLGNVHCLLGLEEDWPNIQRHMRPMSSFLKELRAFDHKAVSVSKLQQMRRRLCRCPAAFSPDTIRPVSSSCASLCRWVNLMCRLAGEQHWLHPDFDLLRRLDKRSMSELGCLARPPLLVATVMGNVHCLLDLPPQWPQIQHSLRCCGEFLHRLQYFNQDSVTQQVRDNMLQRHKTMPTAFKPDIVSKVNASCAMFCAWVNAVCLRAGLDFPLLAAPFAQPVPLSQNEDLFETSWASTVRMSDVGTNATRMSDLGRICLPSTASCASTLNLETAAEDTVVGETVAGETAAGEKSPTLHRQFCKSLRSSKPVVPPVSAPNENGSPMLHKRDSGGQSPGPPSRRENSSSPPRAARDKDNAEFECDKQVGIRRSWNQASKLSVSNEQELDHMEEKHSRSWHPLHKSKVQPLNLA